jgi:phage shock protein PspC (stress-responsive transcriptional regulator)
LSEITKKLTSKRVFKTYFVYFSGMKRFKHFIEWHVFGVCSAIGERMGIATTTIRKYFIYLSFATIGSPVLVYFFLAFWMNVKRYVFNARRNPLRHL